MCPMDDQNEVSRTGVLAEHHVIASTTTLLYLTRCTTMDGC
jgi:hypothetical protein